MQTFHSIDDLQQITEPLHLALGVFDGVHVGHQKVISSAVLAAEKSGGVAGVLTFSPHPIQVLAPDRAPKRILASIAHKGFLVEELGCKLMLVQQFDQAFASQSAYNFIASIAKACPHLQSISVGEDWQFGKGREGNVQSLEKWGSELGFTLLAASPVIGQGERVSSTRIRQAIRDGNLPAIHEMLGRPYTVLGIVLEGRKLARQLGFPTANVKVYNEQLPPDGVWAVEVKVEDTWYPGVGNLGKRPTVENDASAQRLLEVHLFDFEGDLYGKELPVRFSRYIRPEKKFESIDALKAQIEIDVRQVQRGE